MNTYFQRAIERIKKAGLTVINTIEATESTDAEIEITETLSIQVCSAKQYLVVQREGDDFIFSPIVSLKAAIQIANSVR